MTNEPVKVVKRYPLSKQVADKLEKMIETGEYDVGDRIPTEVELMNMFSVSRNTIREAIQSLTSAGVLDVRQGDGTYVRSSNRFNANMSMKCAQVSEQDIKEARNSIEIAIVNLASRRRTEKDMEHISAAYQRRQSLKDNDKENTKADIDFHMAIAYACHNKILIDLYQSISAYMESQIAHRTAETSMDSDHIDMLHEQLYLAIQNKEQYAANVYARNILKI